jgi:hypothetical protein
MSHFSRKVDHPLARTSAISGWVEKPAGATPRRGPWYFAYTPPCAISPAHPTISKYLAVPFEILGTVPSEKSVLVPHSPNLVLRTIYVYGILGYGREVETQLSPGNISIAQ